MPITLEWDNKFDIGHERIDGEHRIFLGLIRELSVQAERHDNPARTDRLIREIYKYADFHFLSEENLMENIGYPFLEDHRRHHAVLLSELRHFMIDQRYGSKNGTEIVEFLFTWFALHTSQEDKRIADFLRATGARSAAG